MAYYFARVELHEDRPEADYAGLHADMAKADFLREIPMAGKTLKLPRATYVSKDLKLDFKTVSNAVRGMAAATNHKFTVVVVEISDIAVLEG